eukprot:s935_g35.t1
MTAVSHLQADCGQMTAIAREDLVAVGYHLSTSRRIAKDALQWRTQRCKYGAPKQDFQVSAALIDKFVFQWTFLSPSIPNHIYNTRA